MNGVNGSERFETVIIGGGQAGLSVGYHLARRGRPFVILDANERIGDSWRKRWDSLRLFTPAKYDGLAGMRLPAPRVSFPTKDEMGDYLAAYAARFELPVRSGVRVDALSKEGDRYLVSFRHVPESGPAEGRQRPDRGRGGTRAPRSPWNYRVRTVRGCPASRRPRSRFVTGLPRPGSSSPRCCRSRTPPESRGGARWAAPPPGPTRGIVPSEPGMYFVGLKFQYAATSDVLVGVGRDAEYVVKHIVSRSASEGFSDAQRTKVSLGGGR